MTCPFPRWDWLIDLWQMQPFFRIFVVSPFLPGSYPLWWQVPSCGFHLLPEESEQVWSQQGASLSDSPLDTPSFHFCRLCPQNGFKCSHFYANNTDPLFNFFISWVGIHLFGYVFIWCWAVSCLCASVTKSFPVRLHRASVNHLFFRSKLWDIFLTP